MECALLNIGALVIGALVGYIYAFWRVEKHLR